MPFHEREKVQAVMACDDEVIPLQARISTVTDEGDLEAVYDSERHPLYVACTRARDHLLVAMNLLSFTFLTNALGLILPPPVMPYWFGLVAIWTPINLFQTLRGAYGSSVLGGVLKTLIVWSATVFWSLVLLTTLLALAVSQL